MLRQKWSKPQMKELDVLMTAAWEWPKDWDAYLRSVIGGGGITKEEWNFGAPHYGVPLIS